MSGRMFRPDITTVVDWAQNTKLLYLLYWKNVDMAVWIFLFFLLFPSPF